MSPRGEPVVAERFPASLARNAAGDYQRLLRMLAARAQRCGSRDPEAAAQEALKRSLENPTSHHAVEYYFSAALPDQLGAPDWRLDQLFAWLHGVVTFVVREERQRASHWREVPYARSDDHEIHEPADPAAGQLDALIQRELEQIVSDCFPMIDREYRAVLKMRVDGMKYGDIANRLGVNENTVATWISRGIRALGHRVRMRTSPRGKSAHE